MIILIGDVHGRFGVFDRLAALLPSSEINGEQITVIQVGDFGIWPGWEQTWPTNLPWPVYFIDGNHEHSPTIKNWTDSNEGKKEPIQVHTNLFYIPRGTVMNLENKTFGFMGGGDSIDYKWRTLGEDWFHEERVQRTDLDPLLNQKIDVLVTHVPPAIMLQRAFPPLVLENWGLSVWDDVSADQINFLWKELGCPNLYCGHMHQIVQWNNCRVLAENEILELKL